VEERITDHFSDKTSSTDWRTDWLTDCSWFRIVLPLLDPSLSFSLSMLSESFPTTPLETKSDRKGNEQPTKQLCRNNTYKKATTNSFQTHHLTKQIKSDLVLSSETIVVKPIQHPPKERTSSRSNTRTTTSKRTRKQIGSSIKPYRAKPLWKMSTKAILLFTRLNKWQSSGFNIRFCFRSVRVLHKMHKTTQQKTILQASKSSKNEVCVD
jgi:hypothetical protein